MSNRNWTKLCCIAVLAAAATGCSSTMCTVVWTPKPEHEKVIDKDLKVCVLKVDVNWKAYDNMKVEGESLTEFTYVGSILGKAETTSKGQYKIENVNTSGEMWSNLLTSEIRDLLAERAKAAGKKIVMVDRDNLAKAMKEKDLVAADIVEGDKIKDKAKLLGYDLLIVGKIDGTTKVQAETNPPPWYVKILPFIPYVGGVAGPVGENPRQRIRRTMTVGGKIEAIDGATAEVWLTHSINHQSIIDKESKPFIGGGGTPMSLVPEEEQIKEMLDFEARRFVGKMVPTQMKVVLRVNSGEPMGDCENGVKQLVINNASALEFFKKALAKDPANYKAAFGASVACELSGNLGEAEKYYSLAVTLGGRDEKFPHDDRVVWEQCIERVKQRVKDGEPATAATQPANTPDGAK